MPDAIQRILKLAKDGGSAYQQQHDTQRGCGHTFGRFANAGQQILHRFGPGLAHQSAQFRLNLAPRRILTKNQPRHRDDDQQQWCQRKHGVVRQRRTHAGHIVVDP